MCSTAESANLLLAYASSMAITSNSSQIASVMHCLGACIYLQQGFAHCKNPFLQGERVEICYIFNVMVLFVILFILYVSACGSHTFFKTSFDRITTYVAALKFCFFYLNPSVYDYSKHNQKKKLEDYNFENLK